ncbi:Coq4 family protein [Spongiimicrobium salis]|uniref:Coq4 family protein n=1 Tax=Spongiimicrobium salis TaxID=1667022 RepID=UPI00374CA825
MRDRLLEYLYEWSKKPYQKFLKHGQAWSISVTELLHYPHHSLGFHLGCFLIKYHFELQPKLENHDVFHVLTGTGISVPEEIGMQYYLFGNGKRSLYLFTVIFMGTLLFPDHFSRFRRAYRKGKSALKFHQIDFSKLLTQPIADLQAIFLIR